MVRRTLFLILAVSGWAFSDTGTTAVRIVSPNPLPVSGTFATPAITTVSFNGSAQQVTSTFTQVQQSTVGVISAGGSYVVTPGTSNWIVTGSTVGIIGAATLNMYVTNPSTITHAGVAQQVTSTFTQVQQSTVGVVSAGGSYVVTPGTGNWIVTGSTVGVISAATLNVYATNPSTITHAGVGQQVTSTSTYIVNPSTVTFNGVGQQVTSTSTYVVNVTTVSVQQSTMAVVNAGAPVFVANQGIVSSTTLRSIQTNGSTTTVVVDSVGRLITSDIPVAVIVTSANANAASANYLINEPILVSSPTNPTRTYLCGCNFMNTSATNVGFTIYQGSSTIVGTPFFPVGAAANLSNAGIRTDCGHPFFWGVPGGQLTIKPSVNAATVSMNCQYFQSQ